MELKWREVAFNMTPLHEVHMFTQLNPPMPVSVQGKGKGYAIGVIDYGQEHNLIWVTALDENGEIWCAPNPIVRLANNWTMSRKLLPNNHQQASKPAASN